MAITLDSIVKLSTTRKITILILLMGAIIGLYYWFFYMPNKEALEQKTAELATLESQVRELRIVAANMKRFQAEAAKLRDELNLAMAQLPTSKEIPSLLANISNLGKESGLEFLLFRPVPEVTREFYAEIPVEIRVKGTYNDVAIFFGKVGKMSRIVNIAGVTMEGAKETFGRWEIMTTCTATTFKFIEKEASDQEKDKTGQKEPKGVTPTKK